MRGTTAAFALSDSGVLSDSDHSNGKGVKLPSILPNLFLRKSLNRSGSDCRTNDPALSACSRGVSPNVSRGSFLDSYHYRCGRTDNIVYGR